MRKIEFLGKMPDPFKKENGTRMTPEEWKEKRDEIRDMIVDIEYGGMPPRAEYVDFERINGGVGGETTTWYRIKTGKKDKYVTFNLEIMKNESDDEKYPVLLTGDACYQNLESDTMKEAFKRRICRGKI